MSKPKISAVFKTGQNAIDKLHDRTAARWLSERDPDPGWYLTYSSMAYRFERLAPSRVFRLVPVPERVVYTLDDWAAIIESTRDLPLRLLAMNDRTLLVPMYYARTGPPCELILEIGMDGSILHDDPDDDVK